MSSEKEKDIKAAILIAAGRIANLLKEATPARASK
jgi:hypothetical protein